MTLGWFGVAAILLSLERIAYVWISRYPAHFIGWWGRTPASRLGSPLETVRLLFLAFKGVQGGVFFAWVALHGDGHLFQPPGGTPALLAGAVAVLGGQTLTLTAFLRLGNAGVFYGNRLGYVVPWCRGFPYSMLSHPQYVGAVISIWGLFLMLRFPAPDWYLIPLLETVYYALGSRFEQ